MTPIGPGTDIDIPELGIVAGDIIIIRPEDPDRTLTIVRRVSRETLMRDNITSLSFRNLFAYQSDTDVESIVN